MRASLFSASCPTVVVAPTVELHPLLAARPRHALSQREVSNEENHQTPSYRCGSDRSVSRVRLAAGLSEAQIAKGVHFVVALPSHRLCPVLRRGELLSTFQSPPRLRVARCTQ